MPPKRSTVRATTASMSAGFVMSAATASTFPPPCASISCRAASRGSARRAQIVTFAPSAASSPAIARPSPWLEAATTAVFPVNPRSMFSSRVLSHA